MFKALRSFIRVQRRPGRIRREKLDPWDAALVRERKFFVAKWTRQHGQALRS